MAGTQGYARAVVLGSSSSSGPRVLKAESQSQDVVWGWEP